ncbi:hypothetical protein AAMO2058_000031400 [Amorphochlora amoebiformis]
MNTGTQPFVVLDIGEAFCKAGFAGESEPRSIFETPSPPTIQRRTLVNGESLYLPPRYSDWKDWATQLINHIYTNILQCNSTKYRVLLLENLDWPYTQKRAIINTILRFDCPGIVLGASALLSTFNLPKARSVLVIDIGCVLNLACALCTRPVRCSPVIPVIALRYAKGAEGISKLT